MGNVRDDLTDLAAGLEITEYDVFYSALLYKSKNNHVHKNYVDVEYNRYIHGGVLSKIPDTIVEYVRDVYEGKAPILVRDRWVLLA